MLLKKVEMLKKMDFSTKDGSKFHQWIYKISPEILLFQWLMDHYKELNYLIQKLMFQEKPQNKHISEKITILEKTQKFKNKEISFLDSQVEIFTILKLKLI